MFTCDALLRQHEWAHNSYRIMLDHCTKLSPEEIARQIDGFGFASVRDQLVHIAGAEAFWVHSAQGMQWPHWDPEEYSSAQDISPLFEQAAEATRAYFAVLSDEALTVPIRVEWEPGQGISLTVALMMSHIITHGFHHKGQVVAMCRLLGYPPPETDLDANIGRE